MVEIQLHYYGSISVKSIAIIVCTVLLCSQLSLLQQKLEAELPNDALVVAGRFPLPDWTPCRIEGDGVDRAWAYSMQAQRQHTLKKNDDLTVTDSNSNLTKEKGSTLS